MCVAGVAGVSGGRYCLGYCGHFAQYLVYSANFALFDLSKVRVQASLHGATWIIHRSAIRLRIDNKVYQPYTLLFPPGVEGDL